MSTLCGKARIGAARASMRSFCVTLFAATAIFVSAASALATDRFVANGGSDANTPCTSSANPCATIGTAVIASSSGDTVHVAAGTYIESITVNKSLTFLGAQANVDARTRSGAESILDASGNGGKTLFFVVANNVIINGFTIENATNPNSFGFAIVLGAGTSGSQILNNIIKNNIAGLSLAKTGVTIKQNLFEDNNQPGPISGTAIYTDQFNGGGSVSSILIDSNSFSGNSAAGLDVGDTDSALPDTQFTISNNSFDSNGQGIVLSDTQSSSITGNTITNSKLSAAAISLDGNDSGLTITGNTLATGDEGIGIFNVFGSGANSDITANQNNITGFAQAGLFVDQTEPAYLGTLDATCNWWGSPSGPFNSTVNPTGTGDAVSAPSSGDGMVSFVSWLNAAAPGGSCVGTPPNPPQTKDECKNGGWRQLTTTTGQPFKNQGACVSFVNTGK